MKNNKRKKKKPTTKVSMTNSEKLRYLFISNNVYMGSAYMYMDSNDIAYSILDAYGGNMIDCNDTLVDDSMDHERSIHQEIEEKAHIDVSF